MTGVRESIYFGPNDRTIVPLVVTHKGGVARWDSFPFWTQGTMLELV